MNDKLKEAVAAVNKQAGILEYILKVYPLPDGLDRDIMFHISNHREIAAIAERSVGVLPEQLAEDIIALLLALSMDNMEAKLFPALSKAGLFDNWEEA